MDDDPMVLQINREYVEAVDDFQVIATARSAQEALQALQRSKPNLVLLDIFMPGGDGLTILKEIRRQEFPIDVILVSAADDVASIQEAMRYGAVDYIIKPFRFERLKTALQSYRAVKFKLARTATLDQEQLDRVLRGQRKVTDALPKGLNGATLKQIWDCLCTAEEALTASDTAEQLGLSRVTVRRYLDYLVKVGRVRMEVQYGSVGRPQNRYRCTGA